MTASSSHHVPVLAEPVARLAAGLSRAVDATVGDGGHTARFLEAGVDVLAIDRDEEAIAVARRRLGDEHVRWIAGAYGERRVHAAVVAFRPELVLMDLGVSSRHLDEVGRGFSFRPGVPLDMRMAADGPTAADFLNREDARDLERVFREHGDEARARRLARAIVERRERQPFRSSDDLVGAIRRALGPRAGPPDFARLFQAVRIAVNREVEQLRAALPAFRDALVPGGCLAVITYHSGEDRLVKHAFREWSRDCVCPPHQPLCTCRGTALGALVPRRPIRPPEDEVARNPRARSAKLRIFRRADGC